MSKLKAKEYKRFEDIKYIRDDGSEYWPFPKGQLHLVDKKTIKILSLRDKAWG